MSTDTLKILAVDDEQLLLYALERACKGRALNITTAPTAEKALTEIDSCHYDLFLLDFDLKDRGRHELLEAVDQRCPYVPVILMTTSDKRSDTLHEAIRACRRQGAWHLLEKPFSLDRMVHCIDMIYQERGRGEASLNPLTHNYEHEMRRETRRPHVQTVNFSYNHFEDGQSCRIAAHGILTDVSDDGLGLLTHNPLRLGQLVHFSENLIHKTGVIAWSVMLDEETYRCGVHFS